jgi:PTS system ascorbate-specific IIA component
MSIGLLLITHNDIGTSLLETAEQMLGLCPLQTKTLPISNDSDPDQLRQTASELIQALDEGDGVLVLTDMYGATPSNIACALQQEGKVAVVAGLNLPMLVRVLNYPRLDLATSAEMAVGGGHIGIMPYRPRNQ